MLHRNSKQQASKREVRRWYRDRPTLIALITGFISSVLSLLNVYLSLAGV